MNTSPIHSHRSRMCANLQTQAHTSSRLAPGRSLTNLDHNMRASRPRSLYDRVHA